MNISLLSNRYSVKKISERDLSSVLKLCNGNPLYYEHCPPASSFESLRADLSALPPKKTLSDKYYIGFYQHDELVSVMDLILGFPNDETAFIGFFMVNKAFQKNGIGSIIIDECLS